MINLARSLHAEILKLKHTLALRLAIVAPLVIVVLQVAMFLDQQPYGLPEGTTPWTWYGQMVMVFWGLLMLPLFVTLETALAGGLEHSDDHWKHLYALPVPRGAIYAAKQFSGMALIGVSTVALPIFLILGGLLLRVLRPDLGLDAPIPWLRIFGYPFLTYLSAWLLISIQTWVNLRWKSFVVASAVGIAMTVAGVVIVNSDWGSFYPWAVAGLVSNQFNEGVVLLPELLFGCLGGIGAAIIGGWDVVRRDVL